MPALEEGQIFERYRIVRFLGSGVSGESYEAHDTVLQRKVTFKHFHPWSTLSDSARRQFFREMQSISQLTHPYLATILDYGEIKDQLYIARRYTSPGSLLGDEGRTWFRPPLDIVTAVQYVHQLSQALEYVHKCGYMHGSLTLANILVLHGPDTNNESDSPPFLIADIGSTHFVRRFGQPRTALLPVTAAPEQLGKRTTPASDQYALAVLLYFWLAGRPPFLGSPEEIEQMKLTETLIPLSSLNSNVTLELEGVVRKALSVYPQDRYSSILTFAEVLSESIQSTSTFIISPEIAAHIASAAEHAPVSAPTTTTQDTPVQEPELNDIGQNPSEPTSPQPGPIPQTVPDIPQPIPTPDPIPQPMPEPLTQPAPEPLPEPAPETLPQPAPDIAQPLPETTPIPPSEPAIDITSHEDQAPLSDAQDAEPVLSARLILTSPHTKEPHEVIIEREETTLGRAGSSDILLDQDTLTSRHHALLKHEGDHYVIYDQHSTHGVFVNGQKIASEEEYLLTDGDRIGIGEYEFTFHFKALSDMADAPSEQVITDVGV